MQPVTAREVVFVYCTTRARPHIRRHVRLWRLPSPSLCTCSTGIKCGKKHCLSCPHFVIKTWAQCFDQTRSSSGKLKNMRISVLVSVLLLAYSVMCSLTLLAWHLNRWPIIMWAHIATDICRVVKGNRFDIYFCTTEKVSTGCSLQLVFEKVSLLLTFLCLLCCFSGGIVSFCECGHFCKLLHVCVCTSLCRFDGLISIRLQVPSQCSAVILMAYPCLGIHHLAVPMSIYTHIVVVYIFWEGGWLAPFLHTYCSC